jgi:hypothetical protein
MCLAPVDTTFIIDVNSFLNNGGEAQRNFMAWYSKYLVVESEIKHLAEFNSNWSQGLAVHWE